MFSSGLQSEFILETEARSYDPPVCGDPAVPVSAGRGQLRRRHHVWSSQGYTGCASVYTDPSYRLNIRNCHTFTVYSSSRINYSKFYD